MGYPGDGGGCRYIEIACVCLHAFALLLHPANSSPPNPYLSFRPSYVTAVNRRFTHSPLLEWTRPLWKAKPLIDLQTPKSILDHTKWKSTVPPREKSHPFPKNKVATTQFRQNKIQKYNKTDSWIPTSPSHISVISILKSSKYSSNLSIIWDKLIKCSESNIQGMNFIVGYIFIVSWIMYCRSSYEVSCKAFL